MKAETTALKTMLLIALTVLLFSIVSLNLVYDFSQLHKFVYYDVLHYLSPIAIFLLTTFTTFVVMVPLISSSKLGFAWILLIPFIYVSEVLINYPNIWARDVYLHGQIWELELYGYLDSIHYAYPKEYPGFFITLYGIYKVLGLDDVRVANLFVLYPALMLVLTILTYITSRQVLKEQTLSLVATTVAFNLLQSNRNELTFVHANVRLYALVLITLELYILLTLRERKRCLISFVVVMSSLALSHALLQFVPVITLLSLITLTAILQSAEKRHTLRSRPLLLYATLSLLILFAWNMYNYYNLTIKVGILSLFDHLHHVMGWELITSSVFIREAVPLLGVILRNYYKTTIALITLVVFAYACLRTLKGRLSYEEAVITSFSAGIVFVFLTTVFSISLGNSIDRMMISLPIPLSILFINAISPILAKVKKGLKGKIAVVLVLVATTIAGYLLVHEVSVLSSRTIPLDNAALFINYKANNVGVLVTSPFDIYYSYFNPVAQIRVLRVDLIESIDIIAGKLLRAPDIKVVDIRSVVIWAYRNNDLHRSLEEFNVMVLSPLNRFCNLVYNNGGFEYVYL